MNERWPGRPLNVGAVVSATIRETSRMEYERRVGELRESLAQIRDWTLERREPERA